MAWFLVIPLVISIGILAYSVLLSVRMQHIAKEGSKVPDHEEDNADKSIHFKEQTDPFTDRIIHIIHKHISDTGLNLDTLAEEMNVSVSQLTRKTKSILGQSPYKLITRIRMEHAVELMTETSMNITEIAHSCGYHELSNFSRAFSKYWQVKPTDMMKSIRFDVS